MVSSQVNWWIRKGRCQAGEYPGWHQCFELLSVLLALANRKDIWPLQSLLLLLLKVLFWEPGPISSSEEGQIDTAAVAVALVIVQGGNGKIPSHWLPLVKMCHCSVAHNYGKCCSIYFFTTRLHEGFEYSSAETSSHPKRITTPPGKIFSTILTHGGQWHVFMPPCSGLKSKVFSCHLAVAES